MRARQNHVLLPDTPNVELESAEQVRALLAETASQLRTGQLDRHAATGIGYLCGIALQALELDAAPPTTQVSFVVHAPGEPDETRGEYGIVHGEPAEPSITPPDANNGHSNSNGE